MSGEKPTPNDFFSDRPPARIMGSETEYNVVDFNYSDAFTDMKNVKGFVAADDTLQNGGRLYFDCSTVLEYVTPEVSSAADLAAYEYAGAVLVTKLCQDVGSPAAYRRTGYDHDSQEPESVGYHENYLIPSRTLKEDARRLMASYASSRPIWSGAGIVGKHFRFSQKAHGIGNVEGTRLVKHGSKPMLKVHIDQQKDSNWGRFEYRATDANMSPWVTDTKFALTSLMLRLTEHPQSKNLQKMKFKHPVVALQDISRDLSLQRTHRNVFDKTMTAIDHQQALIEAALDLANEIEVPLEEQLAAHEVYGVCDELRHIDIAAGELGSLPMRLDWAAKLNSMLESGMNLRDITRANSEAVYKDLTWERIRPRRSVIPAPFRNDRFSNVALKHYLQTPPNTRAKFRAAGKLSSGVVDYDPYGSKSLKK